MTSRPILVIADDQAENLLLLEAMLQEDYEVRTFPDGTDVQLYLKQGGRADIFLLDIVMPHLDGFSLCRQIKANATTRELPVIFITALDSPDVEARGLALGAVDFIHKPFSMPGIKARLRTHLQLAATSRQLREQNENLEALVAQRTREYMEQTRELLQRKQQVISGQEATIRAFCSLAEARDNETGNHIRRTQNYVRILGLELQDHPDFRRHLDDQVVTLLYKSAPLHDIGKVGIPDRILLKPGKLTPEEFEIMKTHTTLGRDAIVAAETETTQNNPFFRYAKEIAYSHQEKWDGSGYPEGLVGNTIPLSARLMAVADVYDALISERVYKAAFSHETAVEIIRDGRGSHFDPDMVDAFLSLSEEFRRIAQQFADSEHALQAQRDRIAQDLSTDNAVIEGGDRTGS